MILFELVGSEEHHAYNDLSIDNLQRQYSFVRSLIKAHLNVNRPMISTAVILALNAHAIACLHVNAGQYRPCPVDVGDYKPPAHYRVPELMNAFINDVNRHWESVDAVSLSSYVLWQVNRIHPFINGNGRTARALCYFVLCLKLGGEPKGEKILPELIKANRPEYVGLLKEADKFYQDGNADHSQGLHQFVQRLLNEQLASAAS